MKSDKTVMTSLLTNTKVELEEVQYEAPSKILADIKTLEDEVQQGLKELEGMI